MSGSTRIPSSSRTPLHARRRYDGDDDDDMMTMRSTSSSGMERQHQAGGDDTNQHSAAVASMLESIGSPSITSPPYNYDRDAQAWAQRQVLDSSSSTRTRGGATTGATTPKMASSDRATTPIMSNHRAPGSPRSTTRSTRNSTSVAAHYPPDDDAATPLPVQTPMIFRSTSAASSTASGTSVGSNNNIATPQPAMTPASLSTGHYVLDHHGNDHDDDDDPLGYGRHYDALMTYLNDKRYVLERMGLAQQEFELDASQSISHYNHHYFDTTGGDLDENGDDDNHAMMMDESTSTLDTFTSAKPSWNSIQKMDTQIEVKFLKGLEQAAERPNRRPNNQNANRNDSSSSSSNSQDSEANLWMLLWHLRGLGVSELLWPDDEASAKQYRASVQGCIETLASRSVHDEPQTLIQQLDSSESTPLAWKRIICLQTWLEGTFRKELPANATRARRQELPTIDPSTGLPSNGPTNDAALLKQSVALLLAGRLDQACQLARDSGQPWRVAQWTGGQPYGRVQITNHVTQKVEYQAVGNHKRALWRHMTWKLTESLQKNSNTNDSSNNADETAMAALLSNHCHAGLDNASLRTSWRKGLYTIVRSHRGRTEDELLYRHNEFRRHVRPPFPGTEFAQQERDMLRNTASVANLSERNMVDILEASPFDEMKALSGRDVFTRFMASFVHGREAVTNLLHRTVVDINTMQTETRSGSSSSSSRNNQLSLREYRFLTHLVIYLNSLQETTSSTTTTAAVVVASNQVRDSLLTGYLQILSQYEHWQYVPLYASLLDATKRLQELPPLLVQVQDFPTRSLVVQQLHACINVAGQDLELITATVQHLLQIQEGRLQNTSVPTDLDVQQIKALQWFDVLPAHHSPTGLHLSNQLLRSFLLQDKVQAALLYLRDHRSENIEALLSANDINNNDDTQEEAVGSLDDATEHLALECFLNALAAENEWQQVVENVAAQQQNSSMNETGDGRQLATAASALEEIANDMQRREYIESQRGLVATLVEVATQTQQALQSVLEYRGGWLYVEQAEQHHNATTTAGNVNMMDVENEDQDDRKLLSGSVAVSARRRHELTTLRRKVVPQVVATAVRVYADTAFALNAVGNQMAQRLECKQRLQVWQSLDPTITTVTSNDEDDVVSAMMPTYWTDQALDLAVVVNSDEFNVGQVMSGDELKQFMVSLSDVHIAHQMYSRQEE